MTPGQLRKVQKYDVRSLSLTYYDGYEIPEHSHDWAQLIYARSGMMRVIADGHLWLVPPTRAIWIPAQTKHRFSAQGRVAFRTLYVAPDQSYEVNREIGSLEISPLLRELILHICALQMLDTERSSHDRLAGLLVDLINEARPIDLMLPLPSDPRALRLVTHFQSYPDDNTGLPQLAATVGASVRTLQRCFLAEIGISIDTWRQKSRLIASTSALAGGSSVTLAALESGYESPSAFIAAFKRQFEMTPGQFAKL